MSGRLGEKQISMGYNLTYSFIRSFIHSFIHSEHLYSAPSRNLLRGAPSPATAKQRRLEKAAVSRQIAARHQAQKLKIRNDTCNYGQNINALEKINFNWRHSESFS